RVRALAPVHFAGQAADLPALAGFAAARGLALIEDACHAIGTQAADADGRWAEIGACRHGGLAAFSFHPVKTIAAGEGGAVTTNDATLAERLRRFRNHGMVREPDRFTDPELGFEADGTVRPWVYEMPEPGFNYRLTDIHSALALSQLGKLDGFVARRRDLMDRYAGRLAPLAPLVRPLGQVAGGQVAGGQVAGGQVAGCRPAWHLCVALIDFAAAGRSRSAVMSGLRARGIGTQVHYVPVHRQPYYRDRCGALALPGADAYYARALTLPLFPAMTDADVDRVVDALAETLGAA
ncbi:MAG TPA: DegT/DnrJ/EryC1/StrS family aminotransferase, partial [Azospirillum sp.]